MALILFHIYGANTRDAACRQLYCVTQTFGWYIKQCEVLNALHRRGSGTINDRLVSCQALRWN